MINGDVIPQIAEKTSLAPAANCPSTISEEELAVSSSSGSTSTSSTDPSISISISISISNETADTSVHEILNIPCTSAIFKVLPSRIDVKDKNISRLTLIQNPESLLLPATNVQYPSAHSHYVIGSESSPAFTTKDFPKTYHDVVDSPEQVDLQEGDISRDMLSKEREEVDTSFISEDHFSGGKKYQADVQSLEDLLAPIPNLEDFSHRSLDEHTSVRAPVRNVPAAPNKWVRPYVAPLRIVKKVQPPVVLLEPLVTRRPPSGNWEQAMDDVLQAFRDAELEDSDFRGLFGGDDSFLMQGSEINTPRDDRGYYLDSHGDDCERRLEESFYSVDESLSMVMASPDLVILKVEDPANVSLSSERAVSRLVMMEVEDENKMDMPEPRLCDCEECEDSYSWAAATDEDDHDDLSQEEDQWSERLELNEYTS